MTARLFALAVLLYLAAFLRFGVPVALVVLLVGEAVGVGP